jgi:FkbM family methyltransferase
LRNIGLQVIKLISLIRYYQFSAGLKIFLDLVFAKKNHYIISSKVFANRIYLRKDQSDPFIFEQIFCEQQYNFGHPAPEGVKWIIDAGANIGLAAIYFSQKFPNAQIISIEPNKENFDLLQKNTVNYKNVVCLNAALWYQKENLHISNKEEKSAGYMIQSNRDTPGEIIQSITMDQLIESYRMNEVSLVKIDIEGSEKELFQYGSSSWLLKCKCIITELHDWLKPGTSQVFFREMAHYDWITYVKGENIICLRTTGNI